MNSTPHFYMCPPTHYEIKYIINDWMDENFKVDKLAAIAQWESVCETYEKLGAEVSIIAAVEGIPELTFAGDSILLFEDTAISSNFRFKERQPEVTPMADWFSERGYSIHNLPKGIHLEGNAETILWNGKMFGGWGIRSDKEAYKRVAEIFDVEVVPLNLKEPYYHLDTGFCPINADTIAYVPGAFVSESRELVAGLAKNTIAIDSKEAQMMACNSKTVGDTVVVSTKQAPNFVTDVKALGLNVVELELSEFLKAGAGAKCLTLEAY